MIRWLDENNKADLAEVADIDVASYDPAWTVQDFRLVLKQKRAVPIIARRPWGAIDGYAIFTLYPSSIDILRLAVKPSERGEGVGSLLLEAVMGRLDEKRRRVCHIEVPDTHLAGHLFLKRHGFQAIKMVEDRLVRGRHVYLFRKMIGAPVKAR